MTSWTRVQHGTFFFSIIITMDKKENKPFIGTPKALFGEGSEPEGGEEFPLFEFFFYISNDFSFFSFQNFVGRDQGEASFSSGGVHTEKN